MKLTKEEALRLHRKMWGDMQKELGDCPDFSDRESYKENWCRKHFPHQRIYNNCFLCEYTEDIETSKEESKCVNCPIMWDTYDGFCLTSRMDYWWHDSAYQVEPISWILSLKERAIK